MAGGHQRSAMFRKDADREKFCSVLGAVVGEERWELHGYCLMRNHYHLLVETPEGQLSRGMKALSGRYAQWFNRRHRRPGTLLESRFRSVLVQKESHLLELLRYIVLNPVRTGRVKRAGDWKWSSYRATAGLSEVPEWLAVDWTLSQLARRRSSARRAFRRFVAEAKGSGKEIEALEKSGCLGDQEFRQQIQELLLEREVSEEIPLRHRKARTAVRIAQVQAEVAREWNVPVKALARRRGGDDKRAAIYLAKRLTGMEGREIGAVFGVKQAQVSHIIRGIDDHPESPLSRRINLLRKRFNTEYRPDPRT
jgi:REP element-mobilizing transposase RayT